MTPRLYGAFEHPLKVVKLVQAVGRSGLIAGKTLPSYLSGPFLLCNGLDPRIEQVREGNRLQYQIERVLFRWPCARTLIMRVQVQIFWQVRARVRVSFLDQTHQSTDHKTSEL